MLYQCTLIGKNGFIEENFFREANSICEIEKTLEMFHWKKGTWEIEPYENTEEYWVKLSNLMAFSPC